VPTTSSSSRAPDLVLGDIPKGDGGEQAARAQGFGQLRHASIVVPAKTAPRRGKTNSPPARDDAEVFRRAFGQKAGACRSRPEIDTSSTARVS
jgi:hypothetical protein